MRLNYNKIIKILTVALVGVAILMGVVWYQGSGNELEVVFMDVGQGDAILIKSPYGQNVLIDGGPDNKVIQELGSNLPFWERSLDLVILTHPHADHITGLVEVLKRYKVEKILWTGVLHTSPDYLAWLDVIKEKNIKTGKVDRRQIIEMGEDLRLEILYPISDWQGKHAENLNNNSVATLLVHGENSILLTGDAEEEEEEELMRLYPDLQVDIFKAGHHGSNTASTADFLDMIQPEIVTISCGVDNKFGHPHLRTLRNLEKRDISVWRTDLGGEITVWSDGENIQVKSERSKM